MESDEEVVDLTSLTPRSEINEIPQTPPFYRNALGAISLLTPSEGPSAKRPPEPPALQSTAAKKVKEEDAAAAAPRNDRSRDGARSRSPSPVTDAIRRFLASRQERNDDERQPPKREPVAKLEAPAGAPVENVTKKVVELSLKKKDVPKRKQLCAGGDEVIIEICHETERSAIAAALIEELDGTDKTKKPFCCFVHPEPLLHGRKCISWLRQQGKKRSNDGTTHERIPYLLILFEASLTARLQLGFVC